MRKILLLIMCAVFLFSSFALCGASAQSNNSPPQHCIFNCYIHCCHLALPQAPAINIPVLATFNAPPFDYIPQQNLFLGGIDHPPKF